MSNQADATQQTTPDPAVDNPSADNNQDVISQFFSGQSESAPACAVDFRTGYVAIVGRPNVGKSTLMNHVLGQKLSITSRKPQTTRHRIMGILTNEQLQAIFVDTPGIHSREVRAINERMNKAATSALSNTSCATARPSPSVSTPVLAQASYWLSSSITAAMAVLNCWRRS